MTERTHDLAGLTFLVIAFIFYPTSSISLVTFSLLLLSNQIGTAFPDLDQPTAEFYRELPAGTILGKIFSPLLGTHRHLSHSILGLLLYSWLFKLLLNYLSTFILVDMNLVFYSFILGYLSHLFMDTLTKEGVPWLFPIKIRFGFPPLRILRITTGNFFEKIVVYGGLVILNGYLIYSHYGKFVDFFATQITR